MKLYSGAGDEGVTSNLSGERVSKNDPLIHFEGTADELNAHLGLIRSLLPEGENKRFLEGIQISLMKLMAHASDPKNDKYSFSASDVKELENAIDALTERLPESFSLIIPGKSPLEAHIHIARTVSRRAERYLAAVSTERGVDKNAQAYLNRLSDYLFALSMQD